MNTMALTYRTMHDALFCELPKWKQRAIVDDRAAGNWDSSVLTEFARLVIKRAEALARPDQPQLAHDYYPSYGYKSKPFKKSV